MELPEENSSLEDILDRVERGEQVPLHRNGRLVANVLPVSIDLWRRQRAVENLLALRRKAQQLRPGLTIEEILDARDSGRK